MSTEITTEGYQDIATNVVVGLWKYLELQTADGVAITRRLIAINTPTYWKDTTLPAYVLETTIKGSDPDLPQIPVSIGKVALFKTAVATTPTLEMSLETPQTISASTDTVVIDITVNIPEEQE